MRAGVMAELTTTSWLLIALAACGGEPATEPPPPSPEECPPPNRVLADGSCVPPGVQDDGCPAGTLASGGACQPAGLTPDSCGAGFAFDATQMSCEPQLPPGACPPGEMAVLGSTACQPVMACPSTPWGGIAIDATTVFVDASYPNNDSDGSQGKPFVTIAEALAVAPAGGLVAVAAGSYAETLAPTKPVRLHGTCPAQVEIVGVSNAPALTFSNIASGSEVKGIAFTGTGFALGASGAGEVTVERVWMHDTSAGGLVTDNTLGAVHVLIRDSLIENVVAVGLASTGADLSAERLEIRGTQPRPGTLLEGRAVNVYLNPFDGTRASLSLSQCYLHDNHDTGVFVAGSDAQIDSVLIRDTMPIAANGSSGRGIEVQGEAQFSQRGTLDMSRSLLENNRDVAVYVSASDLNASDDHIRDTLENQAASDFGFGLALSSFDAVGSGSTVIAQRLVVERCVSLGIFVSGSNANLEGVVVRDIAPRTSDGRFGRGVQAQTSAKSSEAPILSLRGSVVERNHELGVGLSGGNANLDAVVVRDTVARVDDPPGGYGVLAQVSPVDGLPATLWMTSSSVESNSSAGVFVHNSRGTLIGSKLIQTLAAADGSYGDGAAVVSDVLPASMEVYVSAFDDNARAGVYILDGSLLLQNSTAVCNRIDIATASAGTAQGMLTDAGGNQCGCGGEFGRCQALSSMLTAPQPLPPANEE